MALRHAMHSVALVSRPGNNARRINRILAKDCRIRRITGVQSCLCSHPHPERPNLAAYQLRHGLLHSFDFRPNATTVGHEKPKGRPMRRNSGAATRRRSTRACGRRR